MRKNYNQYIKEGPKASIYSQVSSFLKKQKVEKPKPMKNKILEELNESEENRPFMRVLNELENKMDILETKKFTDSHKNSFDNKMSIEIKEKMNTQKKIHDFDNFHNFDNKNVKNFDNKNVKKIEDFDKNMKNMKNMQNINFHNSENFTGNSKILDEISLLIQENTRLKEKIFSTENFQTFAIKISSEINSLNNSQLLNSQKEKIEQTNFLISNLKNEISANFLNQKEILNAFKNFLTNFLENKINETEKFEKSLQKEKDEKKFLNSKIEKLQGEIENYASKNKFLDLENQKNAIELKIMRNEHENLNLLLKKLPVLNLHEREIKENIKKWFNENEKTKFIEKFSKEIKRKVDSCEEIIFGIDKLCNQIMREKNHAKNLNETIEIQKNEIKNLKVFYERKIQKMENQNESNVWSAFELSDL